LFLKARANECPGGTVLSAKGARERVCASRGLEGLAAGRLPAGRKTGEIDLYIVVVKKTFRYSIENIQSIKNPRKATDTFRGVKVKAIANI
jgi:hypothetical protein